MLTELIRHFARHGGIGWVPPSALGSPYRTPFSTPDGGGGGGGDGDGGSGGGGEGGGGVSLVRRAMAAAEEEAAEDAVEAAAKAAAVDAMAARANSGAAAGPPSALSPAPDPAPGPAPNPAHCDGDGDDIIGETEAGATAVPRRLFHGSARASAPAAATTAAARVANKDVSYHHAGEDLLGAALKLLKRMLKRVADRPHAWCYDTDHATKVRLTKAIAVIALNRGDGGLSEGWDGGSGEGSDGGGGGGSGSGGGGDGGGDSGGSGGGGSDAVDDGIGGDDRDVTGGGAGVGDGCDGTIGGGGDGAQRFTEQHQRRALKILDWLRRVNEDTLSHLQDHANADQPHALPATAGAAQLMLDAVDECANHNSCNVATAVDGSGSGYDDDAGIFLEIRMRLKLHRALHYHSVKYILLGVEGYLRDTLPGEMFHGQPHSEAAVEEVVAASAAVAASVTPCSSNHSGAAAAAASALTPCMGNQYRAAAAGAAEAVVAAGAGAAAAAAEAAAAAAAAADIGGSDGHFREAPGFDPRLNAGDVGLMLRLAARNALRLTAGRDLHSSSSQLNLCRVYSLNL